ncbi:hypothetical protein [Paenibacillus taichungensis]
MLKKLMYFIACAAILAGCSNDAFSNYDSKNITGSQLHRTVQVFEGEPVGIVVVDKQGAQHAYGAKVENFDPATLTGELRTGHRNEQSVLDVSVVSKKDVLTSKLIKDTNGDTIGLYVIPVKASDVTKTPQQGDGNVASRLGVRGIASILIFILVIFIFRVRRQRT